MPACPWVSAAPPDAIGQRRVRRLRVLRFRVFKVRVCTIMLHRQRLVIVFLPVTWQVGKAVVSQTLQGRLPHSRIVFLHQIVDVVARVIAQITVQRRLITVFLVKIRPQNWVVLGWQMTQMLNYPLPIVHSLAIWLLMAVHFTVSAT